jgi:adenine specific DNA methylase Mod
MYQITNIEFDLSTKSWKSIDDDSIPQEHVDLVQQELQEEYIGTQWVVDDEDDLIEEITCQSGWCIQSIDYVHVLK